MKLFSNLALSSCSLLLMIASTVGHPANKPSIPRPLPLPIEIIHEFPPGTWLENLAVRSNGKVLATDLLSPNLYQIDPFKKKDPVIVHHFSHHPALSGITETTRDIFYVAAANITQATATNIPGSYDIYEVNLRKGATHAKVTKIANFPQSILLNGLTTFDARKGLIYVAETAGGFLYRLNVQTAQIDIAIDDPSMKPKNSTFPFSINGVKVRHGFVYFTNSAMQTFTKIPISADGTAVGPAITLSHDLPGDDFVLDDRGDAFIAQNPFNNLAFVGPEGGKPTLLTGAPLTDKTLLAGPTACQFGRLPWDRKALYVTTSGRTDPNANPGALGGALARVDLAGSGYFDRGR